MKNKTYLIILIVGLLSFFAGMYLVPANTSHDEMGMDEMRDDFILKKTNIQKEMLSKGQYRCCLEKACTYCIEKTPKHGEGASCSCLEDVVEGRHPCGECIGEILEGHGNRFLAKYFAKSIAEEVGEENISSLKQIISQKYDISIEEQI